ncbi:MAG: hypothetical protein KJ882_11235, partial [Proteobacteria bacterium]|nr:hypothetical protein [Pseudomonadota bacterium]
NYDLTWLLASASSPDAGVPDSQVSSPDSTVVSPDSQMITPDSAVITPDAQVVTPDATVSTPDTAVVSPDAKIFIPDLANSDLSFVVPAGHSIFCWDNYKVAGKSYCDSQKDAVGWQCWSPPVWSGESKPKCLGPAGSACGSFITKPECCVGFTTSFLTTRQCVKVLGRGLSWVL